MVQTMKKIHIQGYWWPADVGDKYHTSLRRIKSLLHMIEICKKLGRTDTVVQAGGSVGVWPRILSGSFKWVYTFEPEIESFELLCLNVPDHNVFKIPAALGNLHGTVAIDKKSLTSHKVDPSQWGPVPMFRIDDLGLRKCDAILLDVEGYEFQALGGAANTIVTHRPLILVEARPEVSSKIDMTDRLLLNHGYRLIISLDGDRIYATDK